MQPADRVLSVFEEINAIPRCSGKEKALADWLVARAADRSWQAELDGKHNVLIRVAGTRGYENANPVALQGHLDMVCEKTPDSTHDFGIDPIVSHRDGEWLTAADTTLGADNGIAIAIALAICESGVPHPPLELLFTVDEESGLTGAQALREGWLRSSVLINIDSEDEGVFTIGCAGGLNSLLRLPVQTVSAPGNSAFFRISISGLQGGHSGVDIHLDRANANVLAARLLHTIGAKHLVIASIGGGSAHNAIPRDAHLDIGIRPSDREATESVVRAAREIYQGEYGNTDPRLDVQITPIERPLTVFDSKSARAITHLLLALPHGVVRMSREIGGLVETSSNLATVRTDKSSVEIDTSQRSSSLSQLEAIADRVAAVAELAGASVRITSRYPPWEPQADSALLQTATKVYRDALGREPVIEVVHAGLECGVIGSKYPDLEMLSIGPTIKMPHSPEERLHIPSLGDFWTFLSQLLVSLK